MSEKVYIIKCEGYRCNGTGRTAAQIEADLKAKGIDPMTVSLSTTQELVNTPHQHVRGNTYECTACGHARQWGNNH